MENFFNRLPEFFITICLSVDYIKAAILFFGLAAVISSFSVNLKTAVYGYPKVSAGLLIVYFLLPLVLYFMAVTSRVNGGEYFSNFAEIYLYLVVLYVAITGLYAIFYYIAEVNYGKREKNFGEVTASLDRAIATLVEEEADDAPIRMQTEKMGCKKPRFEDNVNFRKAEAMFDLLKSKDLSPIERATLKVCENTVKHYKNTVISDDARIKLCNAFLTLVKLYAKYCG